MQFTAQEDIEAPVADVFAALTEFDRIEKQIMRRGIALRRTAGGDPVQAGMAWEAKFGFRGKERVAQITLSEMVAPDLLVFDTVTGGLGVATRVEFVSLSRLRTRINLTSTLAPSTLSARLLVQSLKLAKGSIDTRFRKRVAEYALDLENRLKHGEA